MRERRAGRRGAAAGRCSWTSSGSPGGTSASPHQVPVGRSSWQAQGEVHPHDTCSSAEVCEGNNKVSSPSSFRELFLSAQVHHVISMSLGVNISLFSVSAHHLANIRIYTAHVSCTAVCIGV